MTYDSREDTRAHINRVRELMEPIIQNLEQRSNLHDLTKLRDPEKALFDEYTPKLKDCVYGSDEYKQFLQELKPALDHHYACYDHHPEHFENGVNGMTFMALLEMLADWKAAGERHANGSMASSIEINVVRFGIQPQLEQILRNTAIEMGWL